MQAITIAQNSFNRVSLDFIYALPGQSCDEWASELEDALAYGPGHLSLYQLTIEKGTTFYSDHRKGNLVLPDDDLAADLYELTKNLTENAGFQAYEVSNHALPMQEGRHNLVYWQGGEYIGIGPGAHGRLTLGGKRLRTEQIPAPAGWLAAVARDGHATRLSAPVVMAEQAEEYLMMGLRLADGIDRAQFEQIVGQSLGDCINQAKAAALCDAGLLEVDKRGIRATDGGIQRLNPIISELMT